MCETCVLHVFYTCVIHLKHHTHITYILHMYYTCGTFPSVGKLILLSKWNSRCAAIVIISYVVYLYDLFHLSILYNDQTVNDYKMVQIKSKDDCFFTEGNNASYEVKCQAV